MRVLTLVVLSCFGFGLVCSAQKINVMGTKQKFSGESRDALEVLIYQTSENDVKKEFKSLLKSYKCEKVSMKKEILGDNAMISSISANTVDVYATLEDKGDNKVRLVAAFDLGGIYLAASNSGYKSAKTLLYDFALKLTKMGIEEEMKEEEKLLGKKEKELEQLVKDNDRLHQDIDRYTALIEETKKNIEKAKQDIETNKNNQVTSKQAIESQKKSVARVAEKLKNVK
jgi:hypothetical protein